ncbi:cytochrome c oxidase accessory protein CcoG [Sphingomonas sp. MMS24-J13]|uniref:cytochrome c oxidase accessory protein CcoG n=1 Tax=Sphingomonas sp. MMS24-J13 TaxID=3238686 RepID=UPI00384B2088
MLAPDLKANSSRFFEKRRKVFPKAVDGKFRRLKWAIMAVTLAIYYATPWLRWHRGPYAPDQAVLVDLAHRRFYMFAIEIWPHEFYFVAGLLIMAGIGLFLVTSAVGRAWCGYACPQTVWTDLFVHVERAIEGDRNAQFRLERAGWGPAKIAKRVAKHTVWLLIAFLTGGAWIYYFADAPTLARAVFTGQAPFVAYATIALLTATTYVLGGLMREQVCIYMCPWPRIQGAMLDEKTLVVTYKDWRGEPRSHGTKRVADVPTGDCIDCDGCVAVCPTGIDIRDGAQIGCITCGLCIDACDQVMTRIGRPRGLIDYTTEADMTLARAGQPTQPPLRRLFHIRTIAYFAVWVGIGMGLLFALGTRARIVVSVLQDRNPIYVRLSDGAIRNDYLVKVRNMEDRPRTVEIAIDGVPGAVMWTEQGDRKAAVRKMPLDLAPDQVAQAHLFVATAASGPQRADLTFAVRALDPEGGGARVRTVFERPE